MKPPQTGIYRVLELTLLFLSESFVIDQNASSCIYLTGSEKKVARRFRPIPYHRNISLLRSLVAGLVKDKRVRS